MNVSQFLSATVAKIGFSICKYVSHFSS